MNEIILIGAGGHARSCIDVIENTGKYKIAGLVEKNDSKNYNNLDLPIIGVDSDLPELRKKYEYCIITIGQIKSSKKRKDIFTKLKNLDFKLPTIISPSSNVSKHARIGKGTIIMHQVIVNANAKIGFNCIINNKALIEHDVIIGNNCHISTASVINGGVKVGDDCFIGSGVITKESIEIGNSSIVGAGCILKKNISSYSLIK